MTVPYGLLLVGFDYSNVAQDEFNDWYDTEHIPERERTRGFINAQRWLGVEDDRASVVTYDLESLDVLQSPQYLAIGGKNLSAWSKRMVVKCRRICRFEGEQTVPGRTAAPAGAGALLLVAMNCAPEAEAEFNAWFEQEHLPQLAAVPGNLCARRFTMPSGTHRYLALHHLASPEVQASRAWKDAAETPWTLRMRPHFRDRLRLVLRPYVRRV